MSTTTVLWRWGGSCLGLGDHTNGAKLGAPVSAFSIGARWVVVAPVSIRKHPSYLEQALLIWNTASYSAPLRSAKYLNCVHACRFVTVQRLRLLV